MKRARGMRSWGPASRDSEQNTKKNKRAKSDWRVANEE